MNRVWCADTGEVAHGALRHSTRRRWNVLPFWEGKRVVYDEYGAVGVYSAGVATPLVDREGKRGRR